MTRRVIVESATGSIVAVEGTSPTDQRLTTLPGDDESKYAFVDLADDEAAKLAQPGTYTVDAQGVVTVTPLSAEEIAAQEAVIAAQVERQTAATDLRATAAAIIRRMDAIKDDPTQTDTTAEVRAIVRDDLALAIKKIVRYLAAQAG